MANLVLFGADLNAEVAHFYFTNDTDHKVVAFTVDDDYVIESSLLGAPVVPFNEVAEHFPPSDHLCFVAVGYSGMNTLRTQKVADVRAKGYALANYVSSKATIWPGFVARDNIFILEDNTIQPFTSIGENCTLWSGNHIGHHSRIGNNCFVTSHCVISGNCNIGERTFIGVNATLRDGLTIGEGSLIGAGTLILKDAPPDTLFKGNGDLPAKIPASRIRI